MAQYRVEMTIVDGKGKRSVMSGAVNAASEAAAATRAQAWATATKAMTTGEIESIRLLIDVAVPVGAQGAALASADVEIKGVFAFRAANNKITRMSIPALVPSTKIAGTSRINHTSGPGLAFKNEIVTNGWTDKHGSDIESLHNALEAYGRHA